jgi:hypothetical protein
MSDDPFPFITEQGREEVIREIVMWVRRPVMYIGPNTYELPGVELDPDSVGRMLHEAWEVWRCAIDDYEMQRKPDKPKQALKRNWNPDEVAYDYGEDAGAGLEDWDKFWLGTYYRKPGGKVTDPPVEPLCKIYPLVRDFWAEATGGRDFWLNYPKEFRIARTDPNLFSSAGRLFLGVAQVMDRRYTPLKCESVQNWATPWKQQHRR